MKKEEKYLSIFLIFFGLSALIIGIFSIRSGIRSPFVPRSSGALGLSNQLPASIEPATNEELKGKDTDGDGLNDYEELNVYFTSPYLEDSDSDELNDQKEISAGEDPNCPKGQNCFRQESAGTSGQEDAGKAQDLDSIAGLNSGLLGGSVSAEDLRAMLRLGGMSESDLSQISDDQLLQLYQSALAGEEPPSFGAEPNAVDNPADLTGPQLREILKQSDVPESLYSQYSDADLLKMFGEALKSKQ